MLLESCLVPMRVLSVPRCRETLQGHKDTHSSMRPESPQQIFCHALISKCPNPPRFQPNPHLPTLAIHYNDCTANTGHPLNFE
eukprot:scaffold183342_cov23-Cyclotella_meneghiniana.AAC.1